MKRITILLSLAALTVLALTGAAVKDGYVTRSSTNPTNTPEVFFPQNPIKAIRLVHYDVNGDTNGTVLSLIGGTMPVSIIGILNFTNLQCLSNAGVLTNQLVILQRADDTICSLTVLMTNQSTNIILAATNAAVAISTNDILWVSTNVSKVPINQGRVSASGEAVFMTQRRAPLCLRLSGSISNLNTINNAVVRYDDNAP